jgi:hypothetical protein
MCSASAPACILFASGTPVPFVDANRLPAACYLGQHPTCALSHIVVCLVPAQSEVSRFLAGGGSHTKLLSLLDQFERSGGKGPPTFSYLQHNTDVNVSVGCGALTCCSCADRAAA